MRNGRSLQAIAQELERQLESKKDLVLPASLMRHETSDQGETRLIIDDPRGGSFVVTELARRQLAAKLNIPYPYFDRMRKEQAPLLDDNVNTWLRCNGEHAMVRTLDGQARAVLSDSYRRLDNYDLAEAVLPVLQALPNVRFESAELTPTRMYLKVVVPPLAYTIAPGDVILGGVAIINSEVGHGRLAVHQMLFRVVCANGLIVPDSVFKKTHIGRALGEGSSLQVFQEDTLRADDKAFFLAVRDVVRDAVSEMGFQREALKMQRTLDIKLAGDPVKTVEVLANRYELNEGERTGVLRHLVNGGDLSAYGLINAVTHFSKEVDDYDRATEFEALGGELLELTPKQWQGLATAA